MILRYLSVNIFGRLYHLFNNKYPLTLYQKLTYPIFILEILNLNVRINKQAFIDTFVKSYIGDRKYRENVKGKYIYFVDGEIVEIGEKERWKQIGDKLLEEGRLQLLMYNIYIPKDSDYN